MKEPGTERQILHDLSHIWNLKKSNSSMQRLEWQLPGIGSGATREIQSKNSKAQNFWASNIQLCDCSQYNTVLYN